MDPGQARALVSLLMAFLLFLGVALRLVNLGNVPVRSPDENVYVYQATMVSSEGPVQGTRALVTEYNAERRRWDYPPPTRIGWYWLLGSIMKVTGHTGPMAGVYVSFTASIVTLLVAGWIGLRFFNPVVACVSVLFLAVSPMDLAIARRCWQDALFACVGVGMVACVLDITRRGANRLALSLLVVLCSYALTIKESAFLAVGLCASWVVGFLWWQGSRKAAAYVAGLGMVGALASFLLLSYAAGGAEVLAHTVDKQRIATPENAYVVEYQSGPLLHFVEGFWIMSPVASLLFLLGLVVTLGRARTKDPERFQALFAVGFGALFFAIAFFIPYFQNMRFVSIVYAPFYLGAGIGLEAVFLALTALWRTRSASVYTLLSAVLAIAALYDYRTFRRIIVQTAAVDLSIKMMRDYDELTRR